MFAWKVMTHHGTLHQYTCLIRATLNPTFPANLQASAEMPFDGSGLDDVFLELTGEFSEILSLGPALPMFNDSGACFNPARKPKAAAAAEAPAGAANRQ
jgi:hypothetical protein